MRIERGLAAAASGLVAGAVIGLALGLIRELQLDRVPNWLCVTGLAVVGFAAGRGLVSLMRRRHTQRWRLMPRDAGRSLPTIVMVFWSAVGFALYSDWWSWTASALTGVMVGFVFVPFLLGRLEERAAVPRR